MCKPFFVIIFLFFPSIAFAGKCSKELSFTTLINQSDLIAVIEVSESFYNLNPVLSRTLGQRYPRFRIHRLIKNSLLADTDVNSYHIISENIPNRPRIGTQMYLAFLKVDQPLVWTPVGCGVMAIATDGAVPSACEAINDLFSDRPREREKECFLQYPPGILLRTLEDEISKLLIDKETFSGIGRLKGQISSRALGQHQPIYLYLDTKTKKEFFKSKLIGRDDLVKVYLPTAKVASDSLSRKLYDGSRVNFTGHWSSGNFIIDNITSGRLQNHW